MKKIVLLCISILFLCGCDLIERIEQVPVENMIFDKGEDDKPRYKDENPVKLSLYADNAFGVLGKAETDFHQKWIKKKDIVVFNILLTDEDDITGDYFQDIWKKYADNYTTSYKVGWYVSFELTDGTKFEKVVNSPKDVEDFYDYLEIYLYDSANVAKDVWYSHLLEKDMTDQTIMTSMKLTAGSKYEEINGPIKVMGFTFDSEDDFDENGLYRGNSKYIVNVYDD